MQVRVAAAGINRADLLQAAGRYPAPVWAVPDVLGLEFSGEITRLGEGVTGWREGDRVMGIVGGGAQAEYLVTSATEIIAVPGHWSTVEAAAFPEGFLTAWDAIVIRGGSSSGDAMLCHSIGGGIGIAASMTARALGIEVTGTTRSRWKAERALELGADRVLMLEEGWERSVKRGIDTVIDTLGPRQLQANLSVLRDRGVLVSVGLLAGGSAGEIDLGQMLTRRLSIVGTVMRSRGRAEREQLTARFTREFMPLVERESLMPVVDGTFEVEAVADAFRRVRENEVFGKVVVTF